VFCFAEAPGFASEKNDEQKLIDAYIYLEKENPDSGKAVESYVTLISMKPDTGIAYYLLTDFYPNNYNFVYSHEKNNNIQGYIQDRINSTQLSKKQDCRLRNAGYRMLLAATYLTLYDLEQLKGMSMPSRYEIKEDPKEIKDKCNILIRDTKEILLNIITDKALQRFHPLCRMLKIQMLNAESQADRLAVAKELDFLQSYNRDYLYIVRRYKLEQKYSTIEANASTITDLINERFDLALTQPIDKLKLWEDPLPFYDALMAAYARNKNAEILQRFIPLLNDDNDPPRSNRSLRTEFYYDLANGYLDSGAVPKARQAAETGFKLAIDRGTKDKYLKIIKEIDMNSIPPNEH
jgi:hypothetical protein